MLLTAKNIAVEHSVKKVFEGVTLTVNAGDRIGIAGRNGEGKSTLLAVLAGLYAPDSGEVVYHQAPTVGLLQQSDHLDDNTTVARAVVGDTPEYVWASDRRAREIITVLLENIDWNAPVRQLSGGQRRRVDLAHLLISDSDILLLDEPTNHLDLPAISWLASHLKTRWPKGAGALLVVTHDRWFFDEVSTLTWEVHDKTVEVYEGGYSAFIQQRAERERRDQLAETRRQTILRKELAWLARGAKARTAKPKFRLDAAYALIADDPPLRNSIELKKMAMARLGKQVLELKGVSVAFDAKPVLSNLDWIIGPGERIGLVGENATGKTTLINVITGAVTPDSGEVRVGKTVQMALLSQQLDELVPFSDRRVIEVLEHYRKSVIIDGKSTSTISLLERLGFTSAMFQAPVGDLSGGQRRRLQLLLTLVDEPNFLILDEPGNDLDTDMLAAVEDLLDSWAGTLLLVSHDRYLMERVTDNQFALINGQIRHLPSGIDEFIELLDQSRAEAETSAKSRVEDPEASEQSTGARLYQQRKLLATTERKIDTLEKQKSKIKADLYSTDSSDYQVLLKLEEELQAVNRQLDALEETWVTLTELLE